MAGPSLERLEAGILTTHSPSVDVAYFEFAPNNRRQRDSLEVAPELIADISPVQRRLLGLEVLNASRHFEGIVDVTKFRKYRPDSMKGRVTPEQVLRVVDRMVRADEKTAQSPTTDLVKEAIEDYIDLREGLSGQKSAREEGTVSLEQVQRELGLGNFSSTQSP